MLEYCETHRNKSSVGMKDITGTTVKFTTKEENILKLFGITTYRYKIDKSGAVDIAISRNMLNNMEEYYVVYIDLDDSSVIFRHMKTLDMVRYGYFTVKKAIDRGCTFYGVDKFRISLIDVDMISENRESTLMALASGSSGHVQDGKLFRVYLNSDIILGNFCNTVLTHAVEIKTRDDYKISIDSRIKTMEYGWLQVYNYSGRIEVEVRDTLDDSVLDVLLRTPCIVISGVDSDYNNYVNNMLTFGKIQYSPTPDIEKRFLARYKDELLSGLRSADLDTRWVYFRNKGQAASRLTIRGIAYHSLKRAVETESGLAGLQLETFNVAFKQNTAILRYLASGGTDKDILEAVRNKLMYGGESCLG